MVFGVLISSAPDGGLLEWLSITVDFAIIVFVIIITTATNSVNNLTTLIGRIIGLLQQFTFFVKHSSPNFQK